MDGRPYSIRVVCYFLICCSLDEKEEEVEEKKTDRRRNGSSKWNTQQPKNAEGEIKKIRDSYILKN